MIATLSLRDTLSTARNDDATITRSLPCKRLRNSTTQIRFCVKGGPPDRGSRTALKRRRRKCPARTRRCSASAGSRSRGSPDPSRRRTTRDNDCRRAERISVASRLGKKFDRHLANSRAGVPRYRETSNDERSDATFTLQTNFEGRFHGLLAVGAHVRHDARVIPRILRVHVSQLQVAVLRHEAWKNRKRGGGRREMSCSFRLRIRVCGVRIYSVLVTDARIFVPRSAAPSVRFHA